MHLVPGRLVGRFGIEARLGAGASAQVFRVRDRRSGALRALKVLSAPTAAQRTRFDREVELLRRVEHPNVVGVEGVVEVDGLPALALEYVAGPSLAEALRAGTLTPAEADAIARGVMAGVGALHAAGIVHRDIKPANILLAREGGRLVPKVADLGVARHFQSGPEERLTRAGGALGTPAYMAPEQLRDSSRVDHRADIWALGVMLFEMVCGQRPFPGRTLQEVAAAIERGRPAPRSLFPDLPTAWEEALLATLQRDPARRPSAETLATLWGAADVTELPEYLPTSKSGADEPLSTLALGEPSLAPASADVRRARHNLPWEADAFIGREAELTALAEMLATGGNQVTVTGTGGVGKTRLVRRFAWERLEDWTGGVWFCDLSDARSVEGICFVVAQALDVPLHPRQDPLVQLGHAIAGHGCCLVILDNFEQVAEHGRATVGSWSIRAGDARFLVTSRSVLGLPGERRFSLEPLSLPSEGASAPRAVRESAAASLFVVRAQRVQPSFALTEDTAEDIARLVQQLDGLPLAIELAAARSQLLTPAQILARLHRRFRLLASPRGQRTTRQATLQATLEWSWDLLSATARSALAQVSVFRGGFDLNAAGVVVQLDGISLPDGEILEVQATLDALLEAHLLRREAGSESALEGESARYDLFESIRIFAASKLTTHGVLLNAEGASCSGPKATSETEARHAAHFGAMVRVTALKALERSGGVELRQRLHRDLENLVAGAKRSQGESAGSCCLAAMAVLEYSGPLATGIALADDLLHRGRLSAPVRRHLTLQHGHFLQLLGRGKTARAQLEVVLARARQTGDRFVEGRALNFLGRLFQQQGEEDTAQEYYEGALAVLRETDDREGEGITLGNLGSLHMVQRHVSSAQEHLEAALAIHREVGNRSGMGRALGNLGILQQGQEQMDTARDLFDEALAIHQEVGDRRTEGIGLGNLGWLHRQMGQLDRAQEYLEAALVIHREVGDRREEGNAWANLAGIRRQRGSTDTAREYYEAALAIHREVTNRRSEGVVLGNLGIIYRVQGEMKAAQSHLEAALAIHREVGPQRLVGRVLCSLGCFFDALGRTDTAQEHFEAALVVARETEDLRTEAGVMGNLGDLFLNSGRLETAHEYYSASLRAFHKTRDRQGVGISLSNLGRLSQQQGRLDEAHAHYEAALAVVREVKNRRLEGLILQDVASLEIGQDRLVQAAITLDRVEVLLRDVGDPFNLGLLYCKRGDLFVRQGRLQEAVVALDEADVLAVTADAGPGSELGRAVAELREALATEEP